MEERIIGLVQFLRGEISVCSQRPLDEANRTALTKWCATASAAYQLVPDARFQELIQEIDGLLYPKPHRPERCARRQSHGISKRLFQIPRLAAFA